MQILSVRNLQQGLTQWIAENPRASVPSPGAIDGVWGQQTETSFARWLAASGVSAAITAGSETYGIHTDRRNIEVQDIIFWTLSPFIQRATGLAPTPNGVEPSSDTPRPVPSTVSPSIVQQLADQTSSKIFAGLAVAAALLAGGIGLYYMRNKSRGGRRGGRSGSIRNSRTRIRRRRSRRS